MLFSHYEIGQSVAIHYKDGWNYIGTIQRITPTHLSLLLTVRKSTKVLEVDKIVKIVKTSELN